MGRTGQKLLVICGPTATGKTKLALQLAKILDGVVISADSRQVYKYMDIGTGKEGEVFGYDLVRPDEEFSVASYSHFAKAKIKQIQKENKLPILVGGTGLYIKSVIDNNIDTLGVSQNKKLRKELNNSLTDELFNRLIELNPDKAKSMNESDRKNPRRLIRAIEIASQISNSKFKISKPNYDLLMIGLTAEKQVLKKRIEERVDERIKNGFEKEYNFLKNNGLFTKVVQKTLGYGQWPDIEKWKLEEFKYAKRQMTWFKKDRRIKWFDITKTNYEKEVEKMAKKWHK